jgi:hypothetical protein
VELERLPRMADFAMWAVAAAEKLGYSRETFLSAYSGTCEAAHELALEASAIVPPLRDLLAAKGGAWHGTATELLHDLDEHAPERTRKVQGWPSNGRTLSNALRRIAPNLRAIGVGVTPPQGGRKKGRLFTLERMDTCASPASPTSPSEQKPLLTGDDKGDANLRGDAKGALGGRSGDANHIPENPHESSRGTMGDDGDAKISTHSCTGCHAPFEPLTDGASKTLCRVCQAELRRGLHS